MLIQKTSNNVSIPKEWNVVRLSEIGLLVDGDWILAKHYTKEGVRLIQIGDIGQGNFLDKSQKYISKQTAKKLKCCIINQGNDILISRMPEPIGRACISPFLPYDYIVAVDITILSTNRKIVDNSFLRYLLNSENILKQVQQFVSGSTRQRISRRNLENILLLNPPLREQQKIASILSKLDELIQKTDQIIEQTRRLKRGLMQKLLTKGIGHKEFKKSQIGIMPAEWNVIQLKEICTKIIDMDHKMPMKTREGIPFISVGYLNKSSTIYFDIDKADQGLEFISHEDFLSYSKRFNAEHNDLLISRYGTIGVVKIINTDQEFLASYSIALIKLNRDVTIPLFLAYFLNSSIVKKQVMYMTQTSSNTNLGVLDINKIIVFVPALAEQLRISSILSNTDLYIQKHYNHKRKLEELKKGLMQNLLTGKIRVKV